MAQIFGQDRFTWDIKMDDPCWTQPLQGNENWMLCTFQMSSDSLFQLNSLAAVSCCPNSQRHLSSHKILLTEIPFTYNSSFFLNALPLLLLKSPYKSLQSFSVGLFLFCSTAQHFILGIKLSASVWVWRSHSLVKPHINHKSFRCY